MKNNIKSVLIVEDELMLQEVYQLVLETNGFDVKVANNGLEALTILDSNDPDVVLLDMHMPVMDGREFMHKFDGSKKPRTKIIVYSNLSDSIVEAEVLELGAERFVLKSSMTPGDLVKMVSDL